ncbi:MAG: prepilin-type N-terminal cleavage/methylation domain-containing protein [Candidatus Sulfotelmatobacter sp.]
MKLRIPKSQHGFSLLELMIASVIGIGMMVAMTSVFRQANTAAFTITQRAETQQNMRTAVELMTKDISMAGAGLPTGGLQLAAAGGNSRIACNQTGTCYIPGAVYPTGNYMTGLIPGFGTGVEASKIVPSAPAAVNDSITSIYCDFNFTLTNFIFTFPPAASTPATATLVAVPNASLPTNILAPGGLNVGDLLLFLVQNTGTGVGSGAQGTSTITVPNSSAVAEITSIGGTGPWTIGFSNPDALNFNQAGPNSLSNAVTTAAAAGNTIKVYRLFAVSYFLEVPPVGGTVQTPRLMRQVNGLPAVPVADNIINLQFSYDVINSVTSKIDANQANPILAGDNLALVQKVNMWVMGQSLNIGNNRAQSMYLASSVSAGNMSFCNSLSSSTTVCQ